MTYQLEKLVEEPITIVVMPADTTFEALHETVLPVYQLFCNQTEPFYHIADWSLVGQLDFESLAKTADMTARQEKAPFRHPLLKEFLFVTTNPVYKLAVQGLTAEIYGNIPVHVFDTREEALAYARAQIG